MSKADEAAFPVGVAIKRHRDGEVYKQTVAQPGLSKREWLAGLALQGMMSLEPEVLLRSSGVTSDRREHSTVGEWIADNCVSAADCLLDELSKGDSKK